MHPKPLSLTFLDEPERLRKFRHLLLILQINVFKRVHLPLVQMIVEELRVAGRSSLLRGEDLEEIVGGSELHGGFGVGHGFGFGGDDYGVTIGEGFLDRDGGGGGKVVMVSGVEEGGLRPKGIVSAVERRCQRGETIAGHD